MNQQRNPASGIFLVGFMGSGKSTVGRALADKLGCELVDLDDRIEALAGRPIPLIFEQDGEAAFREIEHEALREQARAVRQGKALVVALGGGAFVAERNRRLLQGCGLTVWLDAAPATLWKRIKNETHRPLARDRRAFEDLLESRRESYALADVRVDADAEPGAVVDEILARRPPGPMTAANT